MWFNLYCFNLFGLKCCDNNVLKFFRDFVCNLFFIEKVGGLINVFMLFWCFC